MIAAEQVKLSVRLHDLLDRLSLEPNRAGFISCPAHSDSTPSLKIYENSWFCFSCHTGGTVIDFYMHYFDTDFKRAMQGLTEMFNLKKGTVSIDVAAQVYRTQKKENLEYKYWREKWLEYRRIINEKHNEFNPKLIEACQKIAYAEYRMDKANGS